MIMLGKTGEAPKIYGPAKKQYCFACRKESEFMLLKIKKRSGKFPLLSLRYENVYYLLCPRCGSKFEINEMQFRRCLRQIKQAEH
jgi:hypothetical protein